MQGVEDRHGRVQTDQVEQHALEKLLRKNLDLIAANVREPIQVIGDIYSLISSNEIGGRRLLDMMDEFELEHIDDLAKHILDHSRAASLAAISKLRPGTLCRSLQNLTPAALKSRPV